MAHFRRTRRRVLRVSPDEDDFAEYADYCGWLKVNSVPRDVSSAVDREVTWAVAPGLIFDYLEAYLTNDACVLVLGEDLGRAEEIMESVESSFEGAIFEESELIDRIELAEDLQDLAGALIRAGLGAPLQYDAEFFDALTRSATSHPEFRIREFAICSMIYVEWAEFVPVLRTIARSDQEERVRDRAKIVFNAYESAGLGDS